MWAYRPSLQCQRHTQPAPQTKLNSDSVRLRNSAEIFVLGPHLRTRIWVGAMIGLLKKTWSICQSGWKEIQNALPVIRWVRWGPRTVIWGLLRRYLPTKVKLRLWRRLRHNNINPFSPKSDQHQFSPNNISIQSREKVRRIKGAVSRNSVKLGNYKMPVKLREI